MKHRCLWGDSQPPALLARCWKVVGAFWLKAGLAHASKLGGSGLSTVQHLACRVGGLTRSAVCYVGPTTRTPACFGQISIRRQGGGQLCGPMRTTLPTWSLRGIAGVSGGLLHLDIFEIVGFRLDMIVQDVLHAIDLGFSAHIVANVFWELLPQFGRNQSERVKALQQLIKAFYSRNRAASRMEGRLTLDRIRTMSSWPKLKAKAAAVRNFAIRSWVSCSI